MIPRFKTSLMIRGMVRGVFTNRNKYYNENWWEMALLPVRIFFQGEDRNMRLFDGKLNPLLLLFALFAFLPGITRGKNLLTEKKILLWFSVLFFLFAFFSTVLRIRYIVVIVPPLVLLATYGIKNLMDRIHTCNGYGSRKILTAGLVMVVATFLSLNVFYLKDLFAYVKPFAYISGDVSRDEYIAKYRFEYPAVQFINRNLPEDSMIWLIYLGKRGYYLDRPYAPEKAGDFIRIVKNSNDCAEIKESLVRCGVTHMMIQVGFLAKWQADIFSVPKQVLLDTFLKTKMKLLYLENDVGVFKVMI